MFCHFLWLKDDGDDDRPVVAEVGERWKLETCERDLWMGSELPRLCSAGFFKFWIEGVCYGAERFGAV